MPVFTGLALFELGFDPALSGMFWINVRLAFSASWRRTSPSRMKHISFFSCLTFIAFALVGCTTHLQRKEQYLQQAGFRAVTPTTPAQIAKVQKLPQGHITQVSKNGKTLFLLADARNNLLLVGGNDQFERYQHLLYKKEVNPAIANEQAIKLEQSEWAQWGGLYGPMGGPFGDPMMGPMFY